MKKKGEVGGDLRDRRIVLGYAATLLSAVTFAVKGIFAKMIYAHGLDPVTLLALRFAIAMPLFWAAVIFFPSEKVTAKDVVILILSGLIGLYGAAILDFYGLIYVDASIERIILYAYPSIVVVLAAIFFKERMTIALWASIALVYVGLAMTLKVWESVDTGYLFGAGLIFGSAVIYAVSYIITEVVARRVSAVKITAYTTTAAAFAFIGTWAGRGAPMPQDPAVWPLIAALAVISTFIPALMVSVGIKLLGARKAAIAGFIGPAFTALLAYIILNERLTAIQWAGMFVVTIGVILTSRVRRG